MRKILIFLHKYLYDIKARREYGGTDERRSEVKISGFYAYLVYEKGFLLNIWQKLKVLNIKVRKLKTGETSHKEQKPFFIKEINKDETPLIKEKLHDALEEARSKGAISYDGDKIRLLFKGRKLTKWLPFLNEAAKEYKDFAIFLSVLGIGVVIGNLPYKAIYAFIAEMIVQLPF